MPRDVEFMVDKRWKKVEGIYHQNREFIKRKELAHLANPFIDTGGSDGDRTRNLPESSPGRSNQLNYAPNFFILDFRL